VVGERSNGADPAAAAAPTAAAVTVEGLGQLYGADAEAEADADVEADADAGMAAGARTTEGDARKPRGRPPEGMRSGSCAHSCGLCRRSPGECASPANCIEEWAALGRGEFESGGPLGGWLVGGGGGGV
jgi:hypothetical protein